MHPTVLHSREPAHDFSKHKSLGSWTLWFCCSFWSSRGEHWRSSEPLLNIMEPRHSPRRAGVSPRGRFPRAKATPCLQDGIYSPPALFSRSPRFLLATSSCAHWSKGSSCPLGIWMLRLCSRNLSFSISMCVQTAGRAGQGGFKNELCL